MKPALQHVSLTMALFVCVASAQAPCADSVTDLTGLTWQLVQFRGNDDAKLVPADKSQYTVTFEKSGTVSVRIDCNRGRGTWKSSARGQLAFGPLALTRAMCPPQPLDDHLPKDFSSIRTYTLQDGHLFLHSGSGSYEYEPKGGPARQQQRSRMATAR
jgi:para-nitrobenzyl esterase